MPESRPDLSRSQALVTFRKWIESQPQFVNPRTEDNFLLRFLHFRKFNLKEAGQVYTNYFQARESYPYCYRNLDMRDPTLRDLIERGYVFPLPQRDLKGRQVIFIRSAAYAQKYGHCGTHIFRSLVMTLETLLEEEENQKRGFVYIVDFKGLSLSEAASVGLFETQKLARVGEKSYPLKHKKAHWLNTSPLVKTCFYLLVGFAPDKVRKRLHVHSHLESLHSFVPPSILPLEYGGTVPWRVMNGQWLRTLDKNRDTLLALDDMNYAENKAKYEVLNNGLNHLSSRDKSQSTTS